MGRNDLTNITSPQNTGERCQGRQTRCRPYQALRHPHNDAAVDGRDNIYPSLFEKPGTLPLGERHKIFYFLDECQAVLEKEKDREQHYQKIDSSGKYIAETRFYQSRRFFCKINEAGGDRDELDKRPDEGMRQHGLSYICVAVLPLELVLRADQFLAQRVSKIRKGPY